VAFKPHTFYILSVACNVLRKIRPMTKLILLIFCVTLVLTACKTNSKKGQADNEANELKYDTLKTTIITWDRNSEFPFDSLYYSTATLTQDDIGQVDSLLVVCAADYNRSLSDGHDEFKIDLKGRDYKKQLMVVTNLKGEKEVWVNCFCDDWDKAWRTEILMVHDGGPCYFNLKINLTTKTFFDLEVNGFA
jgi:hypothetical protein